MGWFNVTIKATVIKTIGVEADNEADASEQAHGLFSAANDGNAEHYTEDTIRVEEGEVARREFTLGCTCSSESMAGPDLVKVWVDESVIEELKEISRCVEALGLLYSTKSLVGSYELLNEDGTLCDDEDLIVDGLFARIYKDGKVGFYLPSKHNSWNVNLDKVSLNDVPVEEVR
jgi:hypothetical protein